MTTQPHQGGDVDLPIDAHHPAPSSASSEGVICDRGESAITRFVDGTGLRDILVDLVNTNARRVLHAEPVETPLSRDRHAIDITDDRGVVWRVDVHNHPRNQAEVAS